VLAPDQTAQFVRVTCDQSRNKSITSSPLLDSAQTARHGNQAVSPQIREPSTVKVRSKRVITCSLIKEYPGFRVASWIGLVGVVFLFGLALG